LDYGGPSYTFPLGGVVDSYKLRAQSHSGSLFVRLAPERGHLRPYFDVMGGYWAFFSEIKDSQSDSSESGLYRLGSDVVGHYGLRAGVDILFVEQARMGLAGVGVSVQWMRGGTLRLPDLHNAEVIDGTLTLDRESTVHAPHQFLFMLSYVLSSNRDD
jgi:hypothetical protein